VTRASRCGRPLAVASASGDLEHSGRKGPSCLAQVFGARRQPDTPAHHHGLVVRLRAEVTTGI
jgi:hypothetical protein